MYKKLFLIVAGISLLIIAISIAYYLVVYLPQKNILQNSSQLDANEILSKNQQFEQTLKCQEEAKKFFDSERTTYPKGDYFADTRVVYYPQLNACVTHHYTTNPGDPNKTKYYEISNLNTGKRIYYYTVETSLTSNKRVLAGDKSEYEHLMLVIFGETP